MQKKVSLWAIIYTLLPSKEADDEKLSRVLTCLGFSERCLAAPAAGREYEPEARFMPGPECAQAFLEVPTATEQVQHPGSAPSPDGGGLLAQRRDSRSLPSGDGRAVQGHLGRCKLILTQHLR